MLANLDIRTAAKTTTTPVTSHAKSQENNSKQMQQAANLSQLLSEYQALKSQQRAAEVCGGGGGDGKQQERRRSLIARYSAAAEAGAPPRAQFKSLQDRQVDDNNNYRQTREEINRQEARNDESNEHEIVVSQCLEQLVDSVVATRRSQYSSFELHEAKLAQTRSTSVSGASSSGDDEQLCGVDRATGSADFVGKFQVQLEQWNEATRCKHAAFILELARQFQTEQRNSQPNKWSLSVSSSEIEQWQTGPVSGELESLKLERIFDCLVDESHLLLVWIAAAANGNASCGHGHSERQEARSKEPQPNRQTASGLDLDDIALALNEPINRASAQHEQRQPSLEVIVWSCTSSAGARRLRAAWLATRSSQLESSHDNGVEPKGQLASGLFVLPLPVEGAAQESILRTNVAAASEQREQQQQQQRQLGQLATVAVAGQSREQQQCKLADAREQQAERRKRQLYETISRRSSGLAAVAATVSPIGSSTTATVEPPLKSTGNEIAQRESAFPSAPEANSSGRQPIESAAGDDQLQQSSAGWRHVANRVLGASSMNRIKNLREEVLKLNQPGRRQSLASVARHRLSMIINPIVAAPLESATSAGAVVPPVTMPRTSIAKRAPGAAMVQAPAPERSEPRSILKKTVDASACSERGRAEGAAAGGQSCAQQRSVGVQAAQLVADKLLHSEGNHEEEEANKGAAFERLKLQRASCNDINRLFSQEPKSQLRARDDSTLVRKALDCGSTANRSRQRRPALLIEEPELDETRVQSQARSSRSDSDGRVRALVGAAHLQRANMDQLAGRRRSIIVPVGGKRSEFDARSLRKLPKELALSLKMDEWLEGNAAAGKVAAVHRTAASDSLKQSTGGDDEPLKDDDDDDELRSIKGAITEPLGANNKHRQSSIEQRSAKFSSKARASLRVGSRATTASSAADQSIGRAAGPISAPCDANELASKSTKQLNKSEAIRLAEANLLAAKQLKQQAQRLKEQQKRFEQQQASMESQAARLLYTQQQVLLSQHYSSLVKQQQAYSATDLQRFQQQQQFVVQRRQQHFQAAHLLAHRQLASIVAAPQQQQQIMYCATQQLAAPHLAYSAVAPGRIGQNFGPIAAYQFIEQQQQQQQQQHFLPMSVNHQSSSFNIVYSPAGLPVQQQQQQQQAFVFGAPMLSHHQHQAPPEAPVAALSHFERAKRSSLGASVRKTVKSLLSHGQQAGERLASSERTTSTTKLAPGQSSKLKSALKSRTSEQQQQVQVFGSDGELAGPLSSSSSTSSSACLSDATITAGRLGKPPLEISEAVSSSSDSSSLASDLDQQPASLSSSEGGAGDHHGQQQASLKSCTLRRSEADLLRQELMQCALKEPTALDKRHSLHRGGHKNSSLTAASTASVSMQRRKNVTFSTKLTSIL